HQRSFVNQCTTALFLMPFPPLPPALPDETFSKASPRRFRRTDWKWQRHLNETGVRQAMLVGAGACAHFSSLFPRAPTRSGGLETAVSASARISRLPAARRTPDGA